MLKKIYNVSLKYLIINWLIEMMKKGLIRGFVGWFFGIIFGLLALSASISGDIIPGLIFFMMMAILIPRMSKYLQRKMNFKLSPLSKIGLIIFGFFLIGLAVDTDTSSEDKVNVYDDRSEKPTSSIKSHEPIDDSISAEKIKLPIIPEYTDKECQRLCYETGDEELKSETYDNIFKSRCKEYCGQIKSLGGNEKLKSTINDLYSTAVLINAKNNKDIQYCAKYDFTQNRCIIIMIEFEDDGSFCDTITDEKDKKSCVEAFLKSHEDYYDSTICEMLSNKTECLLKVKSREAISKKDPNICLSLDDINSCYYAYFSEVLKKDYDELEYGRLDFISENLKIDENELTEALLKYLPVSINGVTTDNIPVITADWSLCDNICERNPNFMKYKDENSFSGKECYRTVCLTEIVLFNSNVDYTECIEYSKTNGQQTAYLDCLMAQAMRDNDQDLCEELNDNYSHFVSTCRSNVKRYNE